MLTICLSPWSSHLTCQTVIMQAALGQGRHTGAIVGHSEGKKSPLRQTCSYFGSGFAPICYQARQKAEITYLDSWCWVCAILLPILLVSKRGTQQPLDPAPQPAVYGGDAKV